MEEFDSKIEIKSLIDFLKKQCEKTWKVWNNDNNQVNVSLKDYLD